MIMFWAQLCIVSSWFVSASNSLVVSPSLVNDTQQRWLLENTAKERAQCQCSVDGNSGDFDVFYWSAFGETYASEDVERGGAYKFIGCGAHKYYRDKAEKQIAGYPWRICYTVGGQRGCQITETSQKHSLNPRIAYRFCNGDYDCSPKANVKVQNGTLLDTVVLDEFDHEGHLQDWTNCCRQCRLHGETCKAWDFNVETNICRLFSDLEMDISTIRVDRNELPMWYSGTPGFDDAPVKCRRSEYDTCKDNFNLLYILAITFALIGVVVGFLAYACSGCGTFGWTNDVTPGYTRHETRTSSSKGGSRTYTVPIHSAGIVYQIRDQIKRETVTREHKAFTPNIRLYFRENRGRLGLIGEKFPIVGCKLSIVLTFVYLALLILIVLSTKIARTDGGEFMAKYTLPGQKSTWVAIQWLCFFTTICVIPGTIMHRRRIRPSNTYSRDKPTVVSNRAPAASLYSRGSQNGAPPKRSAAPVWEFEGDQGWTAYSDEHQNILEAAFQKGRPFVLINTSEWCYKVDLNAKTQCNMDHPDRKVRSVRRISSRPTWEFFDDKGWEAYSNQHQVQLEEALAKCTKDPRSSSVVRISTPQWSYEVDVRNMSQCNVDHPAKKTRSVRRKFADETV